MVPSSFRALCHAMLPVAAVMLAGCFSLQPTDRLSPKIGTEVAVDLNDAGRGALASRLGPEVAQVHGHLIRQNGDEAVLALTSTEFLSGGSKTWAGETLHVHSDYASRYYESRVSTARSLIVGGLVAGTIAVMTVHAMRVSPAVPMPDGGGLEPPGDKLRIAPRTGVVSVNAHAATRAARLLMLLLK